MKKVYEIMELWENKGRIEQRYPKKGESLEEIVAEAEKTWSKRDDEDEFLLRMEVKETIGDDEGFSEGEKLVWLSEWYDALTNFGEVVSSYDTEIAPLERPRYCRIGGYGFYQAYGIDCCGNRYLIEWPVDQLCAIAGDDRPYNTAFPENVYRLDFYKNFPRETSMYD